MKNTVTIKRTRFRRTNLKTRLEQIATIEKYSKLLKEVVKATIEAGGTERETRGLSLRTKIKKLRQDQRTSKIPSRSLVRNIPGYKTIEEPIYDKEYGDPTVALKHALKAVTGKIQYIRANRSYVTDKLATRKPGDVMRTWFKKKISAFKAPTDSAVYTGIEIECLLPKNFDELVLLPFANYVNLGTDGSIHETETHDGAELRVCIKRDEVKIILPKLLEALTKAGAMVNKSCGLHVHLDQRNGDPKRTFDNLVSALPLLYSIVPESRRTNSYCRRNSPTQSYGDALRDERYKAINATSYSKYSTIEVRLFAGTLNAEKMLNWIEMLWAIANREQTGTGATLEHWKFSSNVTAWIQSRQEIYSQATGDEDNPQRINLPPIRDERARVIAELCGIYDIQDAIVSFRIAYRNAVVENHSDRVQWLRNLLTRDGTNVDLVQNYPTTLARIREAHAVSPVRGSVEWWLIIASIYGREAINGAMVDNVVTRMENQIRGEEINV